MNITDKMHLGSLCKNGHDHGGGQSYRYGRTKGGVGKGRCAECALEASTLPEKRAYVLAYHAENYDEISEKRADYFRQYRVDNAEKIALKSDEWRRKNPEKHCAKSGKRRAHKLNATPSWANDFFIEEIYDLAKRRTECLGIPYHVDHIIPLKHPLVCGLHVENNLQVIPAKQNLQKHNHFEIT